MIMISLSAWSIICKCHQFEQFTNRSFLYILRLVEAQVNPLSQPLAERTAMSWSSQRILNSLLLPSLQHFDLKW